MNIIPIASSVIAAVAYEPKSMTLRIHFRNNGIYDYYGVPASLVNQFVSAPSKGKFYAHFIKGRFSQQRIQ